MPEMTAAWVRQSAHDLEHAHAALAAGHHDWACLAAAEAAGKAIKAVLVAHDGRVLGQQNLLLLLGRVRDEAGMVVSEDLMEDGHILMSALAVLSGQCSYEGVAPFELVTRTQAEGAVAAAERIRACMAAAPAAPAS
ncbi:HEPN domain-containing protein [Azospirillum sp. TSO22-1]|uniref:HEPN domain-containing protein n=1 Tax=Azospirillum sp. TSO22-1 TaxID=716789 RepID=UPI001304ED48|nr:HEPN domain-containing protein [Azospirillum sp. TSO22-1]